MEERMFHLKSLNLCTASVALLVAGILVGCSQPSPKTPDVSGNIRQSLDQAGFKDVSVTQDRDKGVVTLGGHVSADRDKAQAESIATSLAGGQVVSNQIAVTPVGSENAAKAVNSDVDEGIEKNLDAGLIQNKLHDSVKYDVKNSVVTLTGEVDSQFTRRQAERIASSIPNVGQVVNELQIKKQRATSSR
jgi:osmotically-inducible protein OsmY